MVVRKRLMYSILLSVGVLSAAPATGSEPGIRGTPGLPAAAGGANRVGVALDPETGILYIPSRTAISAMALVNGPSANPELSASLRVHDNQTGDLVADIELPDVQNGQPMIYMHDGKRVIAMFVSGGSAATQLVVHALPKVAIRSTS